MMEDQSSKQVEQLSGADSGEDSDQQTPTPVRDNRLPSQTSSASQKPRTLNGDPSTAPASAVTPSQQQSSTVSETRQV